MVAYCFGRVHGGRSARAGWARRSGTRSRGGAAPRLQLRRILMRPDLLFRPALLEDAGKLLLRVLVAGLMLFPGIHKIVHGPGHVMEDLAEHGIPVVLAYGVYLGQVVAPILILLGVGTRLAALVYSGTIAFATILVHGEDFLTVEPIGKWAADLWAFYIVTSAVVALVGPGRYALRRAPFPWD